MTELSLDAETIEAMAQAFLSNMGLEHARATVAYMAGECLKNGTADSHATHWPVSGGKLAPQTLA